ncbi:hypothetical protein [Dictyobacter alpinus]|nr:hypothetical protein [Dictyobacter alpinus]
MHRSLGEEREETVPKATGNECCQKQEDEMLYEWPPEPAHGRHDFGM